jgi:hypothetical protein
MYPIITEFSDKCLILKTKTSTVSRRGSLYEAVRKWWRVGERRNDVEYVLGVVDNVVRAVYRPREWIYEEVPLIEIELLSLKCRIRWLFVGDEVVNEAVRQRYLNHQIPAKFIGGQRSERYTWDNKKRSVTFMF